MLVIFRSYFVIHFDSERIVLYGQSSNSSLTFVQVLKKMRTILKSGKYSQIPQLTSSRKMDVTQKFDLIPPACTGTKRAILIGINYVGQTGQLSGCHNDCLNMKDYVTKTYGIEEGNVVVLMDDGKHTEPTRANILAAYAEAVAISESGDALFCHYSGMSLCVLFYKRVLLLVSCS